MANSVDNSNQLNELIFLRNESMVLRDNLNSGLIRDDQMQNNAVSCGFVIRVGRICQQMSGQIKSHMYNKISEIKQRIRNGRIDELVQIMGCFERMLALFKAVFAITTRALSR